MPTSRTFDRARAAFNGEWVVAGAGLVAPATLAGRLGFERIPNETVGPGTC